MEIKINKEVRDYTESVFFGLSLRQSIFSALAVGSAVGIYLLGSDALGTEVTSWLCMLGAAPFAFLGFFRYHGMSAERFFWAWLRSEVLEPRKLSYQSLPLYYKIWMQRKETRHAQNPKKPL